MAVLKTLATRREPSTTSAADLIEITTVKQTTKQFTETEPSPPGATTQPDAKEIITTKKNILRTAELPIKCDEGYAETEDGLCVGKYLFYQNSMQVRSSRPEVFFRKDALRNFAKCSGKHQ